MTHLVVDAPAELRYGIGDAQNGGAPHPLAIDLVGGRAACLRYHQDSLGDRRFGEPTATAAFAQACVGGGAISRVSSTPRA